MAQPHSPLDANVQGLRGLPRDKRDTLWILAVVAWVLAPQIAYVPVWASALGAALLAWRAAMAWRSSALPHRWVVHALLLAVGVGTWLSFGTLIGTQAGVTLVALLLVLKTLEMRARRDAMVLFFLGFFTLLTVFLHSQSLPMALHMVVGLWGLLSALVNAHLPIGKPPLWQPMRTAGELLLWGAPCMVVLFVLFPRMAPLWGIPADSQRAQTGLSATMNVGSIGELAQDPSVALRLRFVQAAGHEPSPSHMYFRGPVLDHFDGTQWSAPSAGLRWSAPRTDPAQALGTALAYEVTLEPHQQRWLLTLDATLTAPQLAHQKALAADAMVWLSTRPITEVLRYTAQVHWSYQTGRELPDAIRRKNTQLPAQGNPKTRAWAAELRAHHVGQHAAILAAALAHLHTGDYHYTLTPQPVASDTADDFWFGQKAGFCEHMASALAVLLRAADVPARVVTGYQGGERNPVDGLWTIRQSDAHAWVEVWLPGDGWTRADPTAAVAPSRVRAHERLLPPPTPMGTVLHTIVGRDTLQHLRATWDAINHRWNDWVIGYTSGQQSRLWQQLQALLTDPTWPLWAAGGTLLILAALWWAVRRQHPAPDPWVTLLQQARARLHAQGIPTAPHMGTHALAQAAVAQWGLGAQALQMWLARMERARYAPAAAGTPSLRALRKEFASLPWPPGQPNELS